MKENTIGLINKTYIKLYDKDGNLKYEMESKNLVVKSGIDLLCDSIANSGSRPAVISYMGLGEGSTAVVDTDTALETPLTPRKAVTYAHTAGTSTFTLTATFNAGEATGAITELGLFNASTAGTMFNRLVFGVITKEAADILTVTCEYTITST